MQENNINKNRLIKLMQENNIGSGLLAESVNEIPDLIQRLLHGGGNSFLIAKVEAVLRGSITSPETEEEPVAKVFSIGVTHKLAKSRRTEELKEFVSQNIMDAKILLQIELDSIQPRKKLVKFLKERIG